MKVSLVTATVGRIECLLDLLESLIAQTFHDFELVIVDQNNDDRLDQVIRPYLSQIDIKHIRSDVRKLSHARNVGIAHCSGEIIGFPDDDCTYPRDVIFYVVSTFARRPDLAMLSGPSITPEGARGSGRWQPSSCAITLHTVWTTVISFNLFVKSSIVEKIGGFDEELGLGTQFGSCEETDLAIRVLLTGVPGWFDTDLNVVHPDKSLTKEACMRAFHYGTGLGRVLRKHASPARVTANFFVRPLAGVALSIARARLLAAVYYWKTFRGRVSGYLAY